MQKYAELYRNINFCLEISHHSICGRTDASSVVRLLKLKVLQSLNFQFKCWQIVAPDEGKQASLSCVYIHLFPHCLSDVQTVGYCLQSVSSKKQHHVDTPNAYCWLIMTYFCSFLEFNTETVHSPREECAVFVMFFPGNKKIKSGSLCITLVCVAGAFLKKWYLWLKGRKEEKIMVKHFATSLRVQIVPQESSSTLQQRPIKGVKEKGGPSWFCVNGILEFSHWQKTGKWYINFGVTLNSAIHLFGKQQQINHKPCKPPALKLLLQLSLFLLPGTSGSQSKT